MSLVVGIDPGLSGALAFLAPDGQLVAVHDMPTVEVVVNRRPRPRVTEAGIASILRRYDIRHAYVEQVAAMPGEGAAGAFSFGVSCGLVRGVLAGLGIPHSLIAPQVWKRAAKLSKDKEASRQRALQLWPGNAGFFMLKKHADRAEAALIALHGLG